MPIDSNTTRPSLRTPKAAALAGAIFSVLTIAAFWLFWISVPVDPQDSGSWLTENSSAVALGLNLIPFAGISFLWFIGALRDRLGDREDRFFATVFFGSALLFLGGLFVASSLVGALLIAFAAEPNKLLNSATLHFGHALAYNILNVYMVKMAAVFMLTTSTVGISTKFVPRWLALLGYGLALALLFGSAHVRWSFMVFPLWVLLISVSIFVSSVQRSDP
jgi:hypothetical protein